jgi:phage terminase large subunit
MKLVKRWDRSKWNSTDRKYTFHNGATIEFLNADGDKAIGPRRDILYVNEANKISYEIYSQLEIRTSQDIYIDFNPTNRFWAHTEVLNEPDSELLILTYRDNEGIPDTVLDTLLSKQKKANVSEYWRNWCKVYIDGEIGALEGTVFNNWTTIDKIPEDAKLIGYGLDFGFTNDPSAVVALYKWNGKIIIDELLFRKGLLNSEIANMLKNIVNKTVSIYADSSEPKSIAEIKAYGLAIKGVKKGPNSVKEGIQLMQE